jgi:hypothetical protein
VSSSRKPPPTASSKEARAGKRAEVIAQLKRDQARQRRRSRLLLAGAVVAAVVIAGAVFVVVGLNRQPGKSQATTSASNGVVGGATQVPTPTFDAVGAGSIAAGPKGIKGTALTEAGKPRVLYIGAEYCPYCAAERWPVTAALSRFGTFSNLGQTASSASDIFPNTPTLSFHGATYSSKYLAFTGVETTSNQRQGSGYAPLDTPSAADEKTFETYDFPPYVSSGGSIPFVDLGGQYVQSGASYDPGLLEGMTHQEVVRAMQSPNSAVAQAVDGSANIFTAALCKLTNDQPANVCSSAGVTAAAAKLG